MSKCTIKVNKETRELVQLACDAVDKAYPGNRNDVARVVSMAWRSLKDIAQDYSFITEPSHSYDKERIHSLRLDRVIYDEIRKRATANHVKAVDVICVVMRMFVRAAGYEAEALKKAWANVPVGHDKRGSFIVIGRQNEKKKISANTMRRIMALLDEEDLFSNHVPISIRKRLYRGEVVRVPVHVFAVTGSGKKDGFTVPVNLNPWTVYDLKMDQAKRGFHVVSAHENCNFMVRHPTTDQAIKAPVFLERTYLALPWHNHMDWSKTVFVGDLNLQGVTHAFEEGILPENRVLEYVQAPRRGLPEKTTDNR